MAWSVQVHSLSQFHPNFQGHVPLYPEGQPLQGCWWHRCMQNMLKPNHQTRATQHIQRSSIHRYTRSCFTDMAKAYGAHVGGRLPKGAGLLLSWRRAQMECSWSRNSTKPRPLERGSPSGPPTFSGSRRIFACFTCGCALDACCFTCSTNHSACTTLLLGNGSSEADAVRNFFLRTFISNTTS